MRQESKFWNAGGFDLRVGLFKGVEISAQSPKTIISGGVEFATPTDSRIKAANGAVFLLNQKPDESWKTWAPPISLNLPQEAAQTNVPAQRLLK